MQSEAFSKWVGEKGVMASARALSTDRNPVSYQRLQHWRKAGIPPELCKRVSQITEIPREELRPDIFG